MCKSCVTYLRRPRVKTGFVEPQPIPGLLRIRWKYRGSAFPIPWRPRHTSILWCVNHHNPCSMLSESSGHMASLLILSGKSPAQHLSLASFMRTLPGGDSWMPRVRDDCRRPSTNHNGLSSCPGTLQYLVSAANWTIRHCFKLSSRIKTMFCTISSPSKTVIITSELDRTTEPYHLPASRAEILVLVCSITIFVSLHRACYFFYFQYFAVHLADFYLFSILFSVFRFRC